MAIAVYSVNMVTRSIKAPSAKRSRARGSTSGDMRINVCSVVKAAAYRAGQTLSLVWEAGKNPFARYLLAVDMDQMQEMAASDDTEQAHDAREAMKALCAIPAKNRNIFRYNKKNHDVYAAQIIAPDDAPAWVYDREILWSKAENAEKRIDSQLARDVMIPLPVELTPEQNLQLVHDYVKQQFVSQGMVADVCLHSMDREKAEAEGKPYNPHAHVLLTTRQLEEDGFASAKCEAWKPPIVKNKNAKAYIDPEYIIAERHAWELFCNAALEDAGSDARIDMRSLDEQQQEAIERGNMDKARELGRKPTFHLGKNAFHAEKRGMRTQIGGRLHDIEIFNRMREHLLYWREEIKPCRGYKLPVLDKAKSLLHDYLEGNITFPPKGENVWQRSETARSNVSDNPAPISPWAQTADEVSGLKKLMHGVVKLVPAFVGAISMKLPDRLSASGNVEPPQDAPPQKTVHSRLDVAAFDLSAALKELWERYTAPPMIPVLNVTTTTAAQQLQHSQKILTHYERELMRRQELNRDNGLER